MAYVALSCVRSVSGVYLTTFNSESIKISISCLKEVNRPRQTYRKDLPIFSKKRKLISRDDIEASVEKHTLGIDKLSSPVFNIASVPPAKRKKEKRQYYEENGQVQTN